MNTLRAAHYWWKKGESDRFRFLTSDIPPPTTRSSSFGSFETNAWVKKIIHRFRKRFPDPLLV
jgi:hypothetical protein